MCDNCSHPAVSLSCKHCHDFQFCSTECADKLAVVHHAVCYDTMHDDIDHLHTLMFLCGLPLIEHEVDTEDEFAELAHAAIGEFLIENNFPSEALEFIERGMARKKPRRKPRVRRKRAKKTKKTRKNRAQSVINKKKKRVRTYGNKASRAWQKSRQNQPDQDGFNPYPPDNNNTIEN